MLNKIFNEINVMVLFWLSWLPGRTGGRLRNIVYRKTFASFGQGIGIPPGCTIQGKENIHLGNHVSFGMFNQIHSQRGPGESSSIQIGNHCTFNTNVMINADCGGKIVIKDKVSVGPNVVFRAANHRIADKDTPFQDQGHDAGTITVEDDVWIGSNVVVLPNVVIGKGSVLAAGAVVNRNVAPYSIVGGVPAKPIGTRE